MAEKRCLCKNDDAPRVISITQAAKMLGMKYSAAYKLIVLDGKISFLDFGYRNKKVLENSIRAYIHAHIVKGEY